MSIIHLLVSIGLIYMGVRAILSRKEKDLFDYLRIRKVPLFLIPILFLESILLQISASFVNICSQVFFENAMQDTLENAARNLGISLIVLCLIPALFEEILFRGAIMRGFPDSRKGVLLSAVLFALWHFNPNQITYTFLAGLLLAILALWTDNLVCSMIVHFLFNLYNLLAVSLSTGSIAGQAIIALDKLTAILIPTFYTTQGIFIWKNFIIGFITFIVTVALYIGILWCISRDERKKLLS